MRKEKRPKKAWKRWQKITLTVAAVVLVAGLGLLLFPTVSNFFGQQRANVLIERFENSIQHVVPENEGSADEPDDQSDSPAAGRVTAVSYAEALEKGEIDAEGYIIDDDGVRVSDEPVVFEVDLNALYRDSVAYNKSLIHNQGTVDTSDYSRAALDMSSYGLSNVYCYLSAPTIGLKLPVYLGANDEMMSCGAVHLSGTSLPIDQTDTNIAVAGHTGYMGRIFFDNIRGLKYGDVVTITNYWETIAYRAVDFKVVKEGDTSDIVIRDGSQLLTLITCCPSDRDDVFDRYLVICEKVQ